MRTVSKSSMFAVVLLTMFAASAHAQDIITVKVPFPFMVGSESFPAGHYDIQPADFGSSVISIRGLDKNPSSGFALTSLAGGTDPDGDQPVLVFKKWENTYRLAEIWQSKEEGRELPQFSDSGTSPSNGAPAPTDGFTGDSTYIVTASRN
jgi:hypothetical protein